MAQARGEKPAAPARPTPEQLDDALASADIAVGPSMPALAAEVRALRAETASLRKALDIRDRIIERAWDAIPDGLAVEDDSLATSIRAALAARTPQPAEPAECPSCDGTEWACYVCQTPHEGWLYEAPRAPLPAVPDGEDREPRLRKIGEVQSDCPCCGASAEVCAGVSGCCEQCAEIGRLNMHATADPSRRQMPVTDGEDVPARLDAAAEASPAVGDLVEYVEDGGVLGKVTAVCGGTVTVEFPNGVATGAPSEFAVVRAASRPTGAGR